MTYFPVLYDLSPFSAHLCLDIERIFLSKLHLKKGLTLLLALSGGADSTALAIIFKILSARLNLSLTALTLNHGLRKYADRDVEFVLSLCNRLEIPCVPKFADIKEFSIQHKCSVEEAGRIVRYSCLEQERVRTGSDYIILAHHLEDLVEDVLMRLSRGTGWPALGGMAAIDDERHIIRPLLFTRPQDLKQLLSELNVCWCEDETNFSDSFKRNRFRHHLVPSFKKENPNFEQAIGNLWTFAQYDKEYWEITLNGILKENPWRESKDSDGKKNLFLPRALLLPLQRAVRLRLYLKAIQQISRSASSSCLAHANAKTLLALDNAYSENRGNRVFMLPGNLKIVLKNHSVTFIL